ncbi:MAG TPA: DNRLRE domain-containing protein, partial [Actinoplanes sp.]|nr:DNRLRE domain-containing protein [Actinoplanes sp.]
MSAALSPVRRALVVVGSGLLLCAVVPAGASAVPAAAGEVRSAAVVVPQPSQHRGVPARTVPARLPEGAGESMPRAGRVRELTDRRTANGKVFELSDGRVQAEVSTEPVHYRDGQGRWQEVDTRVAGSDRPGFGKGAVRNGFGALFGDRSDRLVRVEAGGRHVELGLPGAPRAVVPTVGGSTVTYPGAAGGADVQYVVTAGAVKERIVLRERPAGPVSYEFTLRTGGVEAVQRPDGSVVFVRRGGGAPVFTIPRPVMFDGRDDAGSPLGRASSEQVTQRVVQRGAQTTITVTPDAAWLQAAERHYPVVVDPTIKIEPTIPNAQDTMILSTAPTANYGTTWPLSVGTTGTGAYRSLVQFPLTGIPAGTKIDSAQLKMYYDQTHTAWQYDVPVEVRRVAAAWSETTATWSSIATQIGGVPSNLEQVDDGDAGKTASTGAWPYSTNPALTQYALNDDYQGNKDAVVGDSYTWVPRITEAGSYKVEASYVPSGDRTTAAPYTVTYSGGSATVNVNQAAGTGGVWADLGTRTMAAGTTGKVVVRDSADPAKVTVADAVRFTKSATDTKRAAVSSVWHSFSVRNTVQNWVSGIQPNYGFMLKAVDEATLGRGGPMYEAAEQFYGGETDNRPKLVVTWGRPGVTLTPPTTVTGTGPALDWSAYADPS